MNGSRTPILGFVLGLLAPGAPAGGNDDQPGRPPSMSALTVLSLCGFAVYGASAGLFQGGEQVALAALKVPLIVLFSIALTIPSLVVTTSLSGVTWQPRRLALALLSFAAALSLILSALLPVAWLFSVSSRHLLSPVVVHALVWLTAVLLARRALRPFLGGANLSVARTWTLLLLIVSVQATTFFQPVLYRAEGEAWFPRPRQLFVNHLAAAARVALPEASAGPAAEEGSRRPRAVRRSAGGR